MDKQWVESVLNRLAAIGGTGQGGSNRLAFSDEDMAAREYFKEQMRESGLAVREDAFGNLIGRLEGSDPSLPAVGTGSHIDTVPNGGHFDGMAGSVASLLAIRRIREKGMTRHPLECIIFQMEESSRFSLATFGSKVMVGKADLAIAEKATDKSGLTLPQAMAARGFAFSDLPDAARKKGELACFIELHIEQSPSLEERGLPVGIVTAIAAPIRTHIVIEGKASHSGGTAMNNRRDALVSAADMTLAVRRVGNAFARREIVATVGNLTVFPGAMNVVPGKAELWIDLRGTNRAVMDEAQAALEKAARGIEAAYGTPFTLNILGADNPVPMTPRIIDLMGDVARDLGVPSMPIVSGAGHDTMNMAAITDVGMVFIRCRDGLSHNPGEFAALDDIMAGAKVLGETLYRLAV
ncbi:MAG: M20 family metallo-hydrolase [Deltaproteobacteria bacterium]|jgi:N-carbamoyl-L-amino-acid hydrolase|nr:M20 family metallo-hydrolase [Deltaproteobacteria bacterium]